MKKILFVCTGNICRSPMAEYMLKDLLKEKVIISSAGIYGEEGLKATRHVRDILSEHGINADNHRARQLTQDILDDADFVFCMTKGHKDTIEKFYKPTAKKLFWMGDYTSDGDVADPYYGERKDYERTYEVLKSALEKIIRLIS